MNGMKAKAARKRLAAKFTEDGLPRDPNDWTEDDWRDLHTAISEVKAKVKARHDKARCKKCGWPLAKTVAEGCTEGNCSFRGK